MRVYWTRISNDHHTATATHDHQSLKLDVIWATNVAMWCYLIDDVNQGSSPHVDDAMTAVVAKAMEIIQQKVK